MKSTLLLTCVLILNVTNLIAQNDIIGLWKTIDDNTGKERSVVEIYKKGNLYFGKVIKLYRAPSEEQNPMCKSCNEADDRFNQSLIGMNIIRDLKKVDDEYEGGTVLDPESGTVYKCKIWIEDDDLMLKGYVGFFFRTQTWKKYTERQ